MSFPLYIARRIDSSSRIAIAGIAVGVAVMILSVAIVVGFKKEIREKAIGFGGHLQVMAMTGNRNFETVPICITDTLFALIKDAGVEAAKPYATKPAVLKTADDFLAVVIKGETELEADGFFARNLRKGALPKGEREILVSEAIAQKMRLEVGDKVQLFFIRADQSADPFALGAEDVAIKTRQLTVAGLYDTGFQEFDRQLIVGNLGMLQSVSGWDEDMVSGVEVNIADFSVLEEKYYALISSLSTYRDRRGTAFFVQTIEERNPQIFAWLDLLDTNVWVILLLMTVVASFTMINGLLIIILERTSMIGVLKAMGCSNFQLRAIFLSLSAFIIGKGLLVGNVVGLGLCFAQKYFHLIALDPKNYYLEWVPISINIYEILAINVATVLISLFVLLFPSSMVARVSPVKAIKTE